MVLWSRKILLVMVVFNIIQLRLYFFVSSQNWFSGLRCKLLIVLCCRAACNATRSLLFSTAAYTQVLK